MLLFAAQHKLPHNWRIKQPATRDGQRPAAAAAYLRRKDKAEGPAHHAANQEAGPEAAAAALRPAPSCGQQLHL